MLLNLSRTEVTTLRALLAVALYPQSGFGCKGLCLHLNLTNRGALGPSHLHKSPLRPPTMMFPLFVSHLVSIKLLCFPLQWIRLLQRVHPAHIYSYTWAQHFSCQQTDTSLFTQLELGLFFCFLETSLKSPIILSLVKTVAPAERNSAYGLNTATLFLFLKRFFLLH